MPIISIYVCRDTLPLLLLLVLVLLLLSENILMCYYLGNWCEILFTPFSSNHRSFYYRSSHLVKLVATIRLLFQRALSYPSRESSTSHSFSFSLSITNRTEYNRSGKLKQKKSKDTHTEPLHTVCAPLVLLSLCLPSPQEISKCTSIFEIDRLFFFLSSFFTHADFLTQNIFFSISRSHSYRIVFC